MCHAGYVSDVASQAVGVNAQDRKKKDESKKRRIYHYTNSKCQSIIAKQGLVKNFVESTKPNSVLETKKPV